MTPRRRDTTTARRWASVADTAAYYSISADTVKRRIADGSIRGYRVPGCRGIRIDLAKTDAAMRTVPSAVHR